MVLVKLNQLTLCCAFSVLASNALIADEVIEAEEPETGYFRTFMTPIEVIGEAGAQSVADVLVADEEITWQLYVPHNYSPDNPPGVVVYVSPYERGGPPRAWNDALADKNLIWIGANNAGNKSPVAERMLKAMFAPLVLQKNYKINLERCYVAGFSGGGTTATRISSARPEQFKGGIYIAGTIFWGDNPPPKLELIKQNRHVFMAGTYDPAMKTTQRVYKDYKDAGVTNSELISIRNHNHRMPPSLYFIRAIEYLDSGISTQEAE